MFSDASSLCYPAVAALFYQALHLILSEHDRWPRELLLRAVEVTILPPRCVYVCVCVCVCVGVCDVKYVIQSQCILTGEGTC